MRFSFEAGLEFEAENINDAFNKLSEHYGYLARDESDKIDVWFVGEMRLHPIDKEE